MKRSLALLSASILVACAAQQTKEQTLVNRAIDALGGADKLAALQTVYAKGTAKQWEPEQSDMAGGEARFANDTDWQVWQNRPQQATRFDVERRFQYPTPRTFKFSELTVADSGYVLGVDSNSRNAQSQKMNPPAHSMSGLRLATTQREGLRAAVSGLLLAMRNNPTQVRPSVDMEIGNMAYPAAGYGPFTVAFDPKTGLPARIRTLDYDNIWGDVTYDMVLSDWRDFNGIKVAMNRKYELNGRTVQDVQFTDFQANPSVDPAKFGVPAELSSGAAKPATGNVPYQWVIRRQFIGIYLDSDNTSFDSKVTQSLRLNDIAPGVVHVVGGSHNSLLVEMDDHLVMVDAPVSDAQSIWVVNAAKQRFPGKPIKWLVLTHHHMDHAGGMRGALAEGAVLVVGQGTAQHYRKALAAPMNRNPDMKPMDFSKVQILEIPDSHVMSDSKGKQVVAYAMQDNPHAKGLLMVWVPDAKLGYTTDVYSPGAPLPDKPNAALISVVRTVQRAGITPERIAGGHGGVAPYEPLAKLASQ